MSSAYKLVNLLDGAPLPPALAPFTDNMFSLVVINPYPLEANDATLSGTPLSIYTGQHVCWVTNRVRVPVPTAPSNPSGGSLDFPQVGQAARNSLGSNLLDYDIRFLNFENSIGNITDISTKAAMLVDFLAQNFDERTISAAITNVYTQSLPIGDSLDVSYNLSTGVSFDAVIRSLSIEAAFAMPDGLDFVSKVFALVADYASRSPRIYIGGYLSVRLVGQKTAATMGMQRWSPTCCVEYAMIAGSAGVNDFINDLQKLALACNGALHWGQCNEVMTAADILNLYGRANVEGFRRARAILSQNGTLRTFDNSFTDRLGLSLEVPIPAAGLLVTGRDNQVYLQTLDTSSNAFGGYFLISPGIAKAVAPGANLEIFVIGTDNQVYFLKLNSIGRAITPYTLIPNPVKAISVGSGELFVIGTDDQVYLHKLDPTGNPVGGYVPVPGPVKMKAISLGFDLFAIGVDDQVYVHRLDANGDPAGGYLLIPNPVKAIAAGVYRNPGLFVIGMDDQVYVHNLDANGNPVGNYIGIPNRVKAISATSNDLGKSVLFVIGTDDQVYLHQFDVNGNATGNYIPIPNPVKAVRAERVYLSTALFVIGVDDQVYLHHLDPDGNPVSGYIPIPNQVSGLRGVISLPTLE
jgi:hypothetical protein